MNDQTILNKQPRVSQASIRDHRTQASCSLINIEINPHLSKRNFGERASVNMPKNQDLLMPITTIKRIRGRKISLTIVQCWFHQHEIVIPAYRQNEQEIYRSVLSLWSFIKEYLLRLTPDTSVRYLKCLSNLLDKATGRSLWWRPESANAQNSKAQYRWYPKGEWLFHLGANWLLLSLE